MAARFDLDVLKTKTNLQLGLSGEQISKAYGDERLNRLLDALKKARIFGIDEANQQEFAVITLRAQNLAKYGSDGHSDAHEAVVEVLDDLYNDADKDKTMPRMEMSHGSVSAVDGRRGMVVELAWPAVDPVLAAKFASEQLQRIALEMKHARLSKRLLQGMLFVQANRQQGAVVQLNDMASVNIGSDIEDHTDRSTIELWQHNLYSPEHQLLCLIGAVGLATADEHVERS